MFILVVGAGKVGYHIARELLDIGHEVVLMEKDATHAQSLKTELGSVIIGHDGCEGRWLLEAGVKRADLVLAVTGEDEDNLIISQLASSLSKGRARTIARVNNPKNASVAPQPGARLRPCRKTRWSTSEGDRQGSRHTLKYIRSPI